MTQDNFVSIKLIDQIHEVLKSLSGNLGYEELGEVSSVHSLAEEVYCGDDTYTDDDADTFERIGRLTKRLSERATSLSSLLQPIGTNPSPTQNSPFLDSPPKSATVTPYTTTTHHKERDSGGAGGRSTTNNTLARASSTYYTIPTSYTSSPYTYSDTDIERTWNKHGVTVYLCNTCKHCKIGNEHYDHTSPRDINQNQIPNRSVNSTSHSHERAMQPQTNSLLQHSSTPALPFSFTHTRESVHQPVSVTTDVQQPQHSHSPTRTRHNPPPYFGDGSQAGRTSPLRHSSRYSTQQQQEEHVHVHSGIERERQLHQNDIYHVGNSNPPYYDVFSPPPPARTTQDQLHNYQGSGVGGQYTTQAHHCQSFKTSRFPLSNVTTSNTHNHLLDSIFLGNSNLAQQDKIPVHPLPSLFKPVAPHGNINSTSEVSIDQSAISERSAVLDKLDGVLLGLSHLE